MLNYKQTYREKRINWFKQGITGRVSTPVAVQRLLKFRLRRRWHITIQTVSLIYPSYKFNNIKISNAETNAPSSCLSTEFSAMGFVWTMSYSSRVVRATQSDTWRRSIVCSSVTAKNSQRHIRIHPRRISARFSIGNR